MAGRLPGTDASWLPGQGRRAETPRRSRLPGSPRPPRSAASHGLRAAQLLTASALRSSSRHHPWATSIGLTPQRPHPPHPWADPSVGARPDARRRPPGRITAPHAVVDPQCPGRVCGRARRCCAGRTRAHPRLDSRNRPMLGTRRIPGFFQLSRVVAHHLIPRAVGPPLAGRTLRPSCAAPAARPGVAAHQQLGSERMQDRLQDRGSVRVRAYGCEHMFSPTAQPRTSTRPGRTSSARAQSWRAAFRRAVGLVVAFATLAEDAPHGPADHPEPHPHRRPLPRHKRVRRAGQVQARAHVCLTPLAPRPRRAARRTSSLL
jgi:hypothetical protein